MFEKDGADVVGEGVLDDVGVDGDVVVELDGEVGGGMGGVYEGIGKPAVDGVVFVEF